MRRSIDRTGNIGTGIADRGLLLGVAAIGLLAGGEAGAAALVTRVVVMQGEAAPNGSGNFSGFGSASIIPAHNDAGQVAFFASVNLGDGIFRDDDGLRVKIAREGEAAPDGNGAFSDSFFFPALNNAGHVAFSAGVVDASDGADRGFFRGDGGPLVQIARNGQPAPDGNGALRLMLFGGLNDAGQVAFSADMVDASGALSSRGVFRGDGGPLVQIARTGQAAPDGNGSFGNFDRLAVGAALNDAGQVAFSADMVDASGALSSRGVFRGDGGPPVQIARTGQAAPDGNGSFDGFIDWPILINDIGQVAFGAGVTSDGLPGVGYFGIFRGDGGLPVEIARDGQLTPDGNGSFNIGITGSQRIKLNDVGQVAFIAEVNPSDGLPGVSYNGIFRGDGGLPVEIARTGQLTPDGNGVINSIGSFALTNAGQTVFVAGVNDTSGGSSDGSGIFLFDDILGLVPVVRRGDPLLGSTIDNLFVFGELGVSSSLNELGQFAYSFRLADGRRGIAVTTIIPEPSALLLAAVGLGRDLWAGDGDPVLMERPT